MNTVPPRDAPMLWSIGIDLADILKIPRHRISILRTYTAGPISTAKNRSVGGASILHPLHETEAWLLRAMPDWITDDMIAEIRRRAVPMTPQPWRERNA